LDLLRYKGRLAYIAPTTWQTGDNYSKFRKHLLEKSDISEIINLPFNTFEDAYVETALYFINNDLSPDYKIYNFAKKSIHDLGEVDFKIIPKNLIQSPYYRLILDLHSSSLLLKFNNSNFETLGAITKSTQGLSGNNFPKTVDETETIFPYLYKGNVYNYLLAKDTIYATDLKNNKSLMHFYQAEPKVLIRRLVNRQDRLSVGYTEERLVFKKDINPFISLDHNKFSSKFLLAILASKFISYLYVKSSSIATKDDFRQTTLSELRALPIPNIDTEDQFAFIQMVDQIIIAKKENPKADTSQLENEIDQLVYKLYNLTPEEIKIIENK